MGYQPTDSKKAGGRWRRWEISQLTRRKLVYTFCHLSRETRFQCASLDDVADINCQAQQVLRNLAHEALEGQLADQQLRGLLVLADLAERDRAGAVAVGLLDAWNGERRKKM